MSKAELIITLEHTMKKIIIQIVFICSFAIGVKAQENVITDILVPEIQNLSLREPRFRLYSTNQLWYYLELDTATGKVYSVQISYGNSPRKVDIIDDTSKIGSDDEIVKGRFILKATGDSRLYILLDSEDGRCWLLKWSVNPENRNIERLEISQEPYTY